MGFLLPRRDATRWAALIEEVDATPPTSTPPAPAPLGAVTATDNVGRMLHESEIPW